MTQIDQLDAQAAAAIARLRAALDARDAAALPAPDTADLQSQLAAAEAEKIDLMDELDRLRVKRDKDVAALDELIAQLKPLIEEV
jgi:hypothetical protein